MRKFLVFIYIIIISIFLCSCQLTHDEETTDDIIIVTNKIKFDFNDNDLSDLMYLDIYTINKDTMGAEMNDYYKAGKGTFVDTDFQITEEDGITKIVSDYNVNFYYNINYKNYKYTSKHLTLDSNGNIYPGDLYNMTFKSLEEVPSKGEVSMGRTIEEIYENTIISICVNVNTIPVDLLKKVEVIEYDYNEVNIKTTEINANDDIQGYNLVNKELGIREFYLDNNTEFVVIKETYIDIDGIEYTVRSIISEEDPVFELMFFNEYDFVEKNSLLVVYND